MPAHDRSNEYRQPFAYEVTKHVAVKAAKPKHRAGDKFALHVRTVAGFMKGNGFGRYRSVQLHSVFGEAELKLDLPSALQEIRSVHLGMRRADAGGIGSLALR